MPEMGIWKQMLFHVGKRRTFAQLAGRGKGGIPKTPAASGTVPEAAMSVKEGDTDYAQPALKASTKSR